MEKLFQPGYLLMKIDSKFAADSTFNGPFPRGSAIWPGATLYHGTDAEWAADIVANGINPDQFAGGYYGFGFYVADDPQLCWTNYAGRNGAVVRLKLDEKANILDMRNEDDWEIWKQVSGNGKLISNRELLSQRTKNMKIHGIFDRSMGGLCIWDRNFLKIEGLEMRPELAPVPQFRP